jgi:hypothetical protein
VEGEEGARYAGTVSTRRLSEGLGHRAADAPSAAEAPRESERPSLDAGDLSQIDARLRLTPSERLRYLEDMIAFEVLARRARRLT